MAETMKPEWELFVNEYLVDLNAGKAAKRAGFGTTDGSYRVLGHKLLTKVNIRRAIRKAFKKRLARIQLKQDDVLKELALIGLSDVMDYEVNENSGRLIVLKNKQSSKAVQSVKVKKRTWTEDDVPQSEVTIEYKLWDKLKALELMMRHIGMLSDDKSNGSDNRTIDERRTRANEQARKYMERRRSNLN